jgi:hypothetical protein
LPIFAMFLQCCKCCWPSLLLPCKMPCIQASPLRTMSRVVS